jgi:hypothetical protein
MFPYITYFQKMKVRLCDHVTSMCPYVCLTINFRTNLYKIWYVSISTAHFINFSHQSMSISIPQFLLVKGSVDMFPQQWIILEASFSMRSVSYQGYASDSLFQDKESKRKAVSLGYWENQDSSVCITIGYVLDSRGSIPKRDKRFFSTPQRPVRLWSPTSLLWDGYRGVYPRVQLYLPSLLRVHGVVLN